MPSKAKNPRSDYVFVSVRLPKDIYDAVQQHIREAKLMGSGEAHSLNDFMVRAARLLCFSSDEAAKVGRGVRVFGTPTPPTPPTPSPGPVVNLNLRKLTEK